MNVNELHKAAEARGYRYDNSMTPNYDDFEINAIEFHFMDPLVYTNHVEVAKRTLAFVERWLANPERSERQKELAGRTKHRFETYLFEMDVARNDLYVCILPCRKSKDEKRT